MRPGGVPASISARVRAISTAVLPATAGAAPQAAEAGRAASPWASRACRTIGRTAEAEDDAMRRARQLFARVLECPGGMKIQTIHAFCQSLLRRFPLEAGIPPHFEPLDERSAAEEMLAAREAGL